MATYTGGYSTSISTTASTTTWAQWLQPMLASNATSITYATNAITTWDQWRDVGYITQPIVWQDEVWGQWHRDDITEAEYYAERQRRQDELQAQREQRSREQLAARQAQVAQMAQARVRARELLEELVAAGDWVPGLELIQVRGSDGQLYRVEMHRETVHGNIVKVDEHGCMLGRVCVAPAMYDGNDALPNEDGWLGQYLGLKFDAQEFLSHGNWSGVNRCQRAARELPVAA